MDKYDVAFPSFRAKRKNLEAELAEARARIEGQREAIVALTSHNLAQATQIAAKDAALQLIATECSTFPIKDGLAFRCESIALNALGKEKDNG